MSFMNELPTLIELSGKIAILYDVESQIFKTEGELNRLRSLKKELTKVIDRNRRSLRGLTEEQYQELKDYLGDECESILGFPYLK